MPLILWASGVDARRWGQFVVAALLTALVKEEIALLAAGLGAWTVARMVGRAGGRKAMGNGHGQRSMVTPAAVINNQQSTINNNNSSSTRFPVKRSPAPRNPASSGAAILLFPRLFYVATFVIVPAQLRRSTASLKAPTSSATGARDSSTDILKSIVARPDPSGGSRANRCARHLAGLAIFAWFPATGRGDLLLALCRCCWPTCPAPTRPNTSASSMARRWSPTCHRRRGLMGWAALALPGAPARPRPPASAPCSCRHGIDGRCGHGAECAHRDRAPAQCRPGGGRWRGRGGNYLLYGRGRRPTASTDADRRHHRLLERFVAQLPADAAVARPPCILTSATGATSYQFPGAQCARARRLGAARRDD